MNSPGHCSFKMCIRDSCNILRDADKIDILKVNVDFSPEDIYNVTSEELRACAVTEAVLEDLYAGRAVLRLSLIHI